MKKLITLLFAFLLISGVGFSKISAENNTYTVTIDPGLYGNGIRNYSGPISVPAGSSLTLGDFILTSEYLTNNKYYFRGYHLYGQMDEETGKRS